VSDLQTALAGKLDLIGRLKLQDIDSVKSSQNLVVDSNARESEGLMFNMRPDSTLPIPVKQAIMLAIDKNAVSQLRGLGVGKPLRNPFSNVQGETSWCTGCDPSAFAPFAFDQAKAKQLLADSKFDMNREIVIIGGTGDNAILSLLQANLQAIGLKVKLNVSDTLVTDWQDKGQYDIEWQAGWPSNDPARFCRYWVGDPAQNYYLKATGWVDNDFRAACDAALGSGDPKVQQAQFQKALQIYNDHMGPIESLVQYVGFYAISPDIAGFAQNPADMTGLCGDLGILSWYWKK